MILDVGRRAVLAAILALPMSPLLAAPKEPEPKPLVVLLIADPWLMVIGSDSPAFALYDDGRVIYRAKAGYKSTKLSPAEMNVLIGSLDVGALSALARHYDVADATDQPTETLILYSGAKPSLVSVYGSLDALPVRSKVPSKVVVAFDKMRSFDPPNAQTWLPEKVEVMIWPYEYAPDVSIVWPKDWPSLGDPDTVKRGERGYSIFVPSAQYPELIAFLAGRKQKGAVEIDSKKWAASVRFPFPSERNWMGSSRG